MSPQRIAKRLALAWLLGAMLWSSSVAVAATAMGCCDQVQACCSQASTLGCTTCVVALSTPFAQSGALPSAITASAPDLYPVYVVSFAYADIWRPPKTSAA